MGPNPSAHQRPFVQIVEGIRRAIRKHCLAEDRIRIVLDGLRGK
jgi:hypothetical protein